MAKCTSYHYVNDINDGYKKKIIWECDNEAQCDYCDKCDDCCKCGEPEYGETWEEKMKGSG